jgi:hypothetical protein
MVENLSCQGYKIVRDVLVRWEDKKNTDLEA